jgi:hypothetical protein
MYDHHDRYYGQQTPFRREGPLYISADMCLLTLSPHTRVCKQAVRACTNTLESGP